MNLNDTWEDALAVLQILTVRHGITATSAPQSNGQPEITVFVGRKDPKPAAKLTWWMDACWQIFDANGNPGAHFTDNTHPRVIAKELYRFMWDVTA